MNKVFISHSTVDKHFAEAILNKLESNFIKCWIAPRDIPPGVEYGEAIINGINDCRIMVVVFTENANTSKYVKREVERGVSKGNVVIPIRFQDILPAKSLELFLSADHWLDATSPPFEAHLDKLVYTINVLFESPHTIIPTNFTSQQEKADIRLFSELDPNQWGKSKSSIGSFFKNIFEDKS